MLRELRSSAEGHMERVTVAVEGMRALSFAALACAILALVIALFR